MKAFAMLIAGVAAVLTLTSVSSPARAGLPILYNWGEDFFECGEVPEPYGEIPELSGGKAGYACDVFGLFWAYIAWWDCQPGVLVGDSLYTDPELVSAVQSKYKQADMKLGLWQGYGRWLFALVIVVLIIIGIASKTRTPAQEPITVEPAAPPKLDE